MCCYGNMINNLLRPFYSTYYNCKLNLQCNFTAFISVIARHSIFWKSEQHLLLNESSCISGDDSIHSQFQYLKHAYRILCIFHYITKYFLQKQKKNIYTNVSKGSYDRDRKALVWKQFVLTCEPEIIFPLYH